MQGLLHGYALLSAIPTILLFASPVDIHHGRDLVGAHQLLLHPDRSPGIVKPQTIGMPPHSAFLAAAACRSVSDYPADTKRRSGHNTSGKPPDSIRQAGYSPTGTEAMWKCRPVAGLEKTRSNPSNGVFPSTRSFRACPSHSRFQFRRTAAESGSSGSSSSEYLWWTLCKRLLACR